MKIQERTSYQVRRPNDICKDFFNFCNANNSPNRPVEWRGHRDILTRHFRKTFENYGPFENIAILGAGNCDDIDLSYLTRQCNDITLFDLDDDALQEAKRKYHLHNAYVKTVGDIEFTGLRQAGFYEEFNRRLTSKQAVEDVIEYIRKIASTFDNQDLIEQYKNKYYLVLSSPVQTQLCYPPALGVLVANEKNYTNDEVSVIDDEIRILHNLACDKYHDFLTALGREKSIYFIWTDVLGFTEHNQDLYDRVYDLLESGNHTGLLACFCENGLLGSAKVIKDLQDRIMIENSTCYEFNVWVWPYTDKKKFLVSGIRFSKEDLEPIRE